MGLVLSVRHQGSETDVQAKNKTQWAMEPIGFVHSFNKTQKSAAGRQAVSELRTPPTLQKSVTPSRTDSHDEATDPGMDVIELESGKDFESAVADLEGFSHAWVIFVFHEAQGWRPKVQPPRGISRKVGVFASRAPYRPNPIGLSLVPIAWVDGRRIGIGDSDLLDGTPILDIKPYVATTDALPDAKLGWMEFLRTPALKWQPSPSCVRGFSWLSENGFDLETIVRRQLERDPFAQSSKRVRRTGPDRGVFAYRLWRTSFEVKDQTLHIDQIDHVFHNDVEDSLKARLSPFEIDLYNRWNERTTKDRCPRA